MKGAEFADLANCGEKVLSRQCEVCVIGAGAAGIYLAVELASRGRDVVLLEAGSTTCTDVSALGFDARFEAELYPGATVGRSFGMGGSTSRWGGLLVPHTRHDLRAVAGDFDPWQHIVQTVADKTSPVLDKLGWHSGADFSDFACDQLNGVGETLHSAGFDVTAGLFLPFRKKNLAFLLKHHSGGGAKLRVFYNAVVNGWGAVAGSFEGRVQQAQAVSNTGNRLTISAQRFIIAAGAIESARILLELDQSSPRPLLRASSATGCYLADHLSVSIADVVPTSTEDAIKLFAPRFSSGWMRSFRFLETGPPLDAPRAFLHFIFDNQNPGFALAKEILGALQGRRWPRLSARDVMAGVGGLVQLVHHRYFHSVLYVPPITRINLQLDIEQVPIRENSVMLGDELDRYGRRVARIHWRIGESDLENIRQSAKRFLDKWPRKELSLPELIPRLHGCDAMKPHDAYHPVGTCRMGRDSEAVVDEDLKVWGLENLWVVSTGVLPSAGTANPTFTMLCLAESLAGQLTVDVRR